MERARPRERAAHSRRTVAALALLGLLAALLPSADARADAVGDAQQQLQQARQRAQQAQQNAQQAQTRDSSAAGAISVLGTQIQGLQDQETVLRALIGQLDQQVAHQEAVVAATQQRVADLDLQIANTEAQLDDTQAQLAADRGSLADRLRSLYVQNTTTALNALLSSDDFDALFNRYLAERRVADGENAQVARVGAEQALVEIEGRELDADRARQREQLAAQQAAQQQLQKKRSARAAAELALEQTEAADRQQLAEWQQAKQELDVELAQARADFAAKKNQIGAAQQALAAAQAAAARRHGGGGSGGPPGRFIWPMSGVITQGFGCTPYSFEPYDPNCPSLHFHSGIDVANAYGTPVEASAPGIAYAYESAYGFGWHVIVIHDNGFATLYGHLSGFAVGSGVVVSQGQTIGYEGSTGNSSGPHLHFEIDVNGSPVNPLDHLP